MSSVLPVRLEAGSRAVATRGLVKRYGRDTAVDAVDLEVPEGAVYVLIGPNGAGKSTTLKILLDLVRQDAGEVRVFGLDPRADGPAVRAGIGYVPERHEWGYGWMRVGRLLEHHASYFPSWDRQYAAKLAREFDLRLDKRTGALSKGQGRRVHLTLALAHRPRLLVLDEPTDGLDPVMLDETIGILMEHIAETPTTVIISTHHLHEVDRFADHVGVMKDGRLVMQASRELMHQKLRRYRAETPEPWMPAPDFNGEVLRKEEFGREFQWTIWGDEADLTGRFTNAGIVVRDAVPLTLTEAAITMLRRKDKS